MIARSNRVSTQMRTPQQEALERALARGRRENEETLRQMLKYLLEGRTDWDLEGDDAD